MQLVFVMGAHKTNPVALAHSGPEKEVRYIPIGDDYGILGLSLQPAVDSDGNLCAILHVVAGKASKLMGFIPAPPIVLGELCKIPLAEVRKQIAAAMGDKSGEPVLVSQ